MKPRIRTIKPEAHIDEDLWDLEQETGLPIFRAFSGLWCHADREGRFEWRPRPLKAGILPYWDGDFSRVLDALASRGFVRKYTSDGRDYGVIDTFSRHQFINGKEPESELPSPPEVPQYQEVPRDEDTSVTRESHVPHVPIPSLPFPSLSVPSQEGVQGEPTAPPLRPKRGKPADPMAANYGATQWPTNFEPSPENVDHAKSAGLNLVEEVAGLKANAKRHARVSCDWQAELEGWMVKSVKMRRENAGRPGSAQQRGRKPQENAGLTGLEGAKAL